MNIYIIRHGQTDSNKERRYYGSLDIPLNKKGISQIEKLIPSLSDKEFDSIYSSPASRALESLKVCGDNLYNKVQIDSRLSELSFGEFEGRTYEEISGLYPDEAKEWANDWKSFCPPGGESFIQFYDRVISFFQEILKSTNENTLIITHSGVIKSIYCYILQNNLDLFWSFTCHNGMINIIKYEYGNLFIDGMNKGEL